MSHPTAQPLPATPVSWEQVYPGHINGAQEFFSPDWARPVQFLVGRNGSGKTRTGRALVDNVRAAGAPAYYLSTDRLSGIMSFTYNVSGAGYFPTEYKGAGTDSNAIEYARQSANQRGTANDVLHVLNERPDVYLRLAALLRRGFGRRLRLVETSGFLDPMLEHDGTTYSLLRDEGHGLRELVVLLTSIYRPDWSVVVVDEPELHLHPSLTRLWLQELQAECRTTSRRALVITHEPRLLTPSSWEEMGAIWVTQPRSEPVSLGAGVPAARRGELAVSLAENPQLVGDLVFSPRPVLVEGVGDVAAMKAVATRDGTTESVAQTDYIPCGGKSKIPLWLQVAGDAGLDVRVVADLDALFDATLQRALDRNPTVRSEYTTQLHLTVPSTAQALQPVSHGVQRSGRAPANDTERAAIVAELTVESAGGARRDAILAIWKSAGVWLHPEGRIEEALGLPAHAVSPEQLRFAAQEGHGLDAAVQWSLFRNDAGVDLYELLSLEVERIAAAILAELRYDPDRVLSEPVGATASSDRLLVGVERVAVGRHRLTVRQPARFAGYWIEVDRDSPPSTWDLQKPEPAGAPS